MEAAWTNMGNYAILLKYEYIESEDTGPIQHWTYSSHLSQVAGVWICASTLAFYHKSAQRGGQCPLEANWCSHIRNMAPINRKGGGAFVEVQIWNDIQLVANSSKPILTDVNGSHKGNSLKRNGNFSNT